MDSSERTTPDSLGSESLIKMNKSYVSTGLVVNEKECMINSNINNSSISAGSGSSSGFANNGMVQNLNDDPNKSK